MYKFLFILLLFVPGAHADEAEIPIFDSVPIKYTQKNWIRNSVGEKIWIENEMQVGDFTDKKMKFYVYITGSNYHQCSASGEAEKLSKTTYRFKEDACNLLIKFTRDYITLSDKGNTCKVSYCGNNAYFDKAEFFKVEK